jgi:DUF1680 family protein
MHVMRETGRTAAAVVPTESASCSLRPLDLASVRFGDGLLWGRQQINREITLLHGHAEMEKAGTLENFRIAAGAAGGPRRGMVFSDSDVYKWLEALAWELGREPSDHLSALAAETTSLVASAQEPDGYINTWCQINDPQWRWTDLEMGHELYCAGHLIQAGVAMARATGDESLLEIARRFADLIDDTFRLGPQTGTDGHPEVEVALTELYRLTGERRYLELASTLVERRGHGQFGTGHHFSPEYFQDATPLRDTRTIAGHAVRALYLLSGVTDISMETGDEGLLEVALAQWEDLAAKTYLTGGIGSRHSGEAIGEPHELPPDRAYCETCAAIASIMWNWRLLLATGAPRFADMIERTLYNGFLSGTSEEGDRFFYVNPLQSRGGHRPRESWDPVACCPPNIMRTLASLQQLIATTDPDGIQLHQYTEASIAVADGPQGPIELKVTTDYPWDGRVEVEIADGGRDEWTLALRVPAWAINATVDGDPAPAGEYVRLTRRWHAGEKVQLSMDLSPRLTAPHPRVDAIRGCLAIERGPLVYCVEHVDLPEAVQLADVRIDPRGGVSDSPAPAAGLEGMTAVQLHADVQSAEAWGDDEYRGVDAVAADRGGPQPFTLLAVPYFTWGNRGRGTMRVWIPDDTARGEA